MWQRRLLPAAVKDDVKPLTFKPRFSGVFFALNCLTVLLFIERLRNIFFAQAFFIKSVEVRFQTAFFGR